MILTGNEIEKQRNSGRITIEPFNRDQINPNSYNYRLGSKLGVPKLPFSDEATGFDFIEIPADGYRLEAGIMYLGHTCERLGSNVYAMSLIGRSSLGRLGLFLQVSANLGHTGSCHQWTLELVAAAPIIIYSGMRIGQISFWLNEGRPDLYEGGYTIFDEPHSSLIRLG